MHLSSELELSTLAASVALVPTSAPTYAAAPLTGASSLESVNYADAYGRRLDSLGPVTAGSTVQSMLDARFGAVNGPASPSRHSFQIDGRLFLPPQDWRLRVHADAHGTIRPITPTH